MENNTEVFSSSSRWADILVQEFQLSHGSLPEMQRDTHHLTVNLGSLGTAEHKMNGVWKTTSYPAGSIGFIPAGQLHEPKWDFNSRIVTLSIASQDYRGLNLKEQRGVLDAEVAYIASLLATELRYGEQASTLLADSSAIALQSLLQQKYGSGPLYNKYVYSKLSGTQLANVMDYCTSYMDENISIKELAGLCNLSPFHFLRQFKKTTGIAPYQFLTRLRIDRAKQFLAATDFLLNDIASKLGFADQAHFSRSFKRTTGSTPGEFRAVFK